MSPTNLLTRIDTAPTLKVGFKPASFTTTLLTQTHRPIRIFIPTQYEQKYAYPLCVFFHPDGGNEQTTLDLAPRISDRNLISIGLRGPKLLGMGHDHQPVCTWDGVSVDDMEEDVVRAVEQTRRQLHVHSERIYFVGIGDGARAAYRAGFRMADRIAGIVALNAPYPTAEVGRPLFSIPEIRRLRILIGHNLNNLQCPIAHADRAYRLMYAAGANVQYVKYVKANDDEMLRDVNRWIIGNLNTEHDQLMMIKR